MLRYIGCICALLTSWGFASENLVFNGDFASNNLGGWTVIYAPVGSLLVPPAAPPVGFDAFDGYDDTISQSILTVPGAHYQVQFVLGLESGTTPSNNFLAKFGDTTLLSLEGQSWFNPRVYEFSTVAHAENTLLQFSGRSQYDLFSTSVYLVAPPPFLPLEGLKGNDLTVAEYLNHYASADVIALLLQQGGSLSDTLEKVAPTRNACSTYVAQLEQLGLERVVDDYLEKKRGQQHFPSFSEEATAARELDAFIVQGDQEDPANVLPPSSCVCHEPQVEPSLWLSAFGEYATASSQWQTPGFAAGSGGVVLAMDFSIGAPHFLGAGLAYAHTHLREHQDLGHAKINQGGLFIYGAFAWANWYLNATVGGGYYCSANVRNFSLTGCASNHAVANIQGWQLVPHVEVGYEYWRGRVAFEPFSMLDEVTSWEHSIKETGSSPFNFGQKGRSCFLVRSESGIRFQEVLMCGWGSITFMEKVGYVYQKAFETRNLRAFLVGSPGFFTVTTLTGAQNMGVGELKLSVAPQCWQGGLSLCLHAEGRTESRAYQVIGEWGRSF